MGRFWLLLFIVGSIALVAHLTRPVEPDFRAELEARHAAMTPDDPDDRFGAIRTRMHNDNVLDRMVAAETPGALLTNTEYTDYKVATVFVTRYDDPLGPRRIRTIGLFGTFIPFQYPEG